MRKIFSVGQKIILASTLTIATMDAQADTITNGHDDSNYSQPKINTAPIAIMAQNANPATSDKPKQADPDAKKKKIKKQPAAPAKKTVSPSKKKTEPSAKTKPAPSSTTPLVAPLVTPLVTPLVKPSTSDNPTDNPSSKPATSQPQNSQTPVAANAETKAPATASFAEFLHSTGLRARKEGVEQATIDKYLLTLKTPLAASIAKDRAQGEFILSFRTYFSRTVTPERIARAKDYAVKHKDLLEAAEKKYGVPREIILAFWALESTFGENMGRSPSVLTLATLAFEGRRREFFTNELISALKIIDKNHFDASFVRSGFLSSWAGAMGQVQFMPSTYLQYAVDGDGDGVRDLWHTPADIIFSTANFVSQLGWDQKNHWGQVVTLPSGFPYRDINDKTIRSFHYWRTLGVKDSNDNLIPDHFFYQATVVIPMSAQGPIFLTENNFSVIKKWNNSNFFALSVGLLADYISGRLTTPIIINPNIPDWQTDEMIAIQKNLQQLHYLAKDKTPDGVLGPSTRQAIQKYQDDHGMIADGYPSKELVTILNRDSNLQP